MENFNQVKEKEISPNFENFLASWRGICSGCAGHTKPQIVQIYIALNWRLVIQADCLDRLKSLSALQAWLCRRACLLLAVFDLGRGGAATRRTRLFQGARQLGPFQFDDWGHAFGLGQGHFHATYDWGAQTPLLSILTYFLF